MFKYRISSLMLASIVGLTACGGADDDRTFTAPPLDENTFVVFNPAKSELPVPNDLLFASQTPSDGTMFAGTDPANPVVTGIDALDGASVLSPIEIMVSGSLDPNQTLDAANFIVAGTSVIPNPAQNVFLLALDYPSGDGLSQAAGADGASVEVPTLADALVYQTAVATSDAATLAAMAQPAVRAEIISLNGGTNNAVRVLPLKPLNPKTKYLVVLTGLTDSSGNAVTGSNSYEQLSDPTLGFGANESLAAVQAAVLGWEQLAAGYFGFMDTVFTQVGSGSAPSATDIIFSMTFTTAGTTDVLQYMAAPESFFNDSLSSGYKKDSIVKLVTGDYHVNGSTSLTEVADVTIAATINALLTSPTIPGSGDPGIPNALYNATIAGAIGQGADYATIAADATAAYIMQRAAAEAAISVHDNDGITIAQEAAGTVQGIVAGVSAQAGIDLPTSAVFPIPAPRTSNFFRVDAASSLNPALAAPANIYQGEITLPYYQEQPTDTDLSPVVSSSWTADPTIGAVIDAGRGNPAGTTPPTDMITYRYPFPAKKSDVTIPLLVTVPDETTLGALGITRPAGGWPVIVFAHGITGERSTSLPMANALAFACVARDAEGNPTGPSGADCFATVAIDQPLHGVATATTVDIGGTPTVVQGSLVPALRSVTDPDATITPNVGDNTPSASLTERHFDVTASADGITPMAMDYSADIGSSGSLFVNLTNFTNVRDNLRQMSVDLLNVTASIATMDLNDDGTADELDASNVYFLGHSLGGIDGLTFVSTNNNSAVQGGAFTSQPMIKAASALKSGGGITRLLTNSQSFAPTILQGLAAANSALAPGQSGLESYLNVFQGVLDSVDVMNFASSLSDANSSTGILLTEVIGDGDMNASDGTIPNAADASLGLGPLNTTVPETGFQIQNFNAPLAGTEPMINQFGAVATGSVTASDGDAAVLVTRFTSGNHGTPVTADPSDVFLEMVSEIATFFTLDGDVSGSIVTNTAIVEQ